MARMREAAGDVQAATHEYKVCVSSCTLPRNPGVKHLHTVFPVSSLTCWEIGPLSCAAHSVNPSAGTPDMFPGATLQWHALRSSRRLTAAVPSWQAMLENFPEYIDCQLRLAAIAARGGKRADAISHLRAILERQPGNTDALAFVGAFRRPRRHAPHTCADAS